MKWTIIEKKYALKVSSSYHLCVECFSQLSFDSEVYTKSAAVADFVYSAFFPHGIRIANKLGSLTHKLLISHIYDNQIKFKVSLHFGGSGLLCNACQ